MMSNPNVLEAPNRGVTRAAAWWTAGLGFLVPATVIYFVVEAMHSSGLPTSRGNLICGLAFLVLLTAESVALLLGIKASSSRAARITLGIVVVPLLLWVLAAMVLLLWQVARGGFRFG